MIERFAEVDPCRHIEAHVNKLPFGAPANVVENGYDYTGYCAKPFAMLDAKSNGADIAILLDASFYPIRSIQPLIDHIAQFGYYFCDNGYIAGEWASDRALERLGMQRDEAMTAREISSYCVGLNFLDGRSVELLHRWIGFAGDRLTFPGPHTNNGSPVPQEGRNQGFCSADVRCRGHRHDQTALSILAHRMGMSKLIARPMFTTYEGHETIDTVLVNRGM